MAVTKKATAKKTTAKKTTAKKTIAKKTTAKKSSVKKTVAKKPAAKKTTVKKATVKKSSKAKSVRKPVTKATKATKAVRRGSMKSAKSRVKTYAEIGAEGEQQIYEVLVQMFGHNYVFRNVYASRASGRLTEIDLVAVHTTGVYVVESKNYSGAVIGDCNEKDWIHAKSETFRRNFYSPVLQNKGHIDTLKLNCQNICGFIPPMLSFIVFPDKCDLNIVNFPPGLRCCKLSQIPHVLREAASKVAPAVSPQGLEVLSSMFFKSQRDLLPTEVQEKHKKDVAFARAMASKG